MFVCKKCGRICTSQSGFTMHKRKCHKIVTDKNGYQYYMGNERKEKPVHRAVVETQLKRKLSTNEIVHHKNQIPSDNQLENLEVVTRSKHMKIHRSLLTKQEMKLERERAFQTAKERGTNSRKLTRNDVRKIKERLRDGELHSVLCKEYGVSGTAIASISSGGSWNHIEVSGFQPGTNSVKFGEKNSSAKLTEDQVIQIKNRLSNFEGLKTIARDYNVSAATVYDIKTGRSWKHVEV